MAAKPLVVMFADSHLADKAWVGRNVAGDSYFSLAQIVDFACQHQVYGVIGAGDLLDRAINRSEPVVRFHKELDRLQAANIPTFYIQGQHELQDQPWLSAHPWPQHLNGQSVMLGIWNFFGLDWHPADHLAIALGTIPSNTHVFVGHQVWAELLGLHPEASVHDIPHAHTLFTGDYHVYKQFKTTNRQGHELLVISPGSTCAQSIDENPDKYFVVLCDDHQFRKVKLKTRRILEAETLNLPQELDRFLGDLADRLDPLWAETTGWPEAVRKPLLRVTYSHRLSDCQRRVMAAVGERAHVFFKEMPPEPTVTASSREILAADGQALNLETALHRHLESQELLPLEADCRRLLTAGDIAGELQRMKAERLA